MKNISIFIGIVFLLTACNKKDDTSEVVKSVRPIKHSKVVLAGDQATHTFSGVAQSGKESKLSFRVGGTLQSMNVQLGDRVRAGQLIATLDPADYVIQAEQSVAAQKGSEASLKSAETALINAKANYDRVEKLYENNNVSLSEFEQAKANLETSQASYDAAVTQVTSSEKKKESADNQVNYTRLVAPFSGVITSTQVEANELVGQGSVIAVLTSEQNPEVSVGIPENFIAEVKKGQNVAVKFSVLPNEVFEGYVYEVSYAAGNAPTYPAVVRIKNPSQAIRPGMAATVTFGAASAEGQKFLVSPVNAIGEDFNGNYAFVIKTQEGENYTVKKQTVKIGRLLPLGFEVLEGLEEGDIVATAGIKSLLDGMEVKLLE